MPPIGRLFVLNQIRFRMLPGCRNQCNRLDQTRNIVGRSSHMDCCTSFRHLVSSRVTRLDPRAVEVLPRSVG